MFALWYGKGPGVDRSLDVLKHGNHAGTSRHGGVLVVAGDDHAAKSSTLPHQSDHVFAAAVIPVLNPSGVQDYLDLGIHGWAMSRYSGCWVAFKAVTDTVESTAVVDVDPHRVEVVLPKDFVMPPGGLSIRWPDPPLVQEARMQEHKAYAALAYARANRLNRIVIDSPRPRLGIITAGKSYLDVRQALDDLGIDERLAAEIGLRVMKVGMTWPLEPEGTRHFAEGLEEILVVEEKRQHLEYQLKEELYNWSEAVRPRVIGKFDEKGEWSLPQGGWLLPAGVRADPGHDRPRHRRPHRPLPHQRDDRAAPRLHRATRRRRWPASASRSSACRTTARAARTTPAPACPKAAAPWPASAATTWRPGSTAPPPRPSARWAARAWPGSARRRSPRRRTCSPISATAPTSTPAFWRSGPRSPPSVNITYKILYNDAVAMTGGQPLEGSLSVAQLVGQLAAEGLERIEVVADAAEAAQYRRPARRRAGSAARRARSGPAEPARDQGHDGADLRPDLRRREAPPPQARQPPRSGPPRGHQRHGLRGLRRLPQQVELRLGAAG